jgi:simple sugar transport system permease protein
MTIFTSAFLVPVLAAAVRSGTPILFAALGEIYAERSGILNLGVEGLMLVGALSGFTVGYFTQNLWLGFIAAIFLGGLLSLIHAFLSITLKVNQIVSGLALVVLGSGLSNFFGKKMIGIPGKSFPKIMVPILSKIPWVGPVLFQHDILVYITYFLVPIMWFILYKTKTGISIRAVGQNPRAADAMGVNVYLVRYLTTFVGGSLAGAGGAYLSLAYAPFWVDNMSAGRGWIAIALTIFALWDPIKVMFGAYLFGGIQALQLRLQAAGTNIPSAILLMQPYIFTLIILIIAALQIFKLKLGISVLLLH